MFKSINVSTFTLARNSLLICRFHFTLEDFLLPFRLISEEKFSLHMNEHTGSVAALCSSASPILRTGRDDIEQPIVKGTFDKEH